MTERTQWPKGHVVRMWLDHGAKRSTSVGTCQCGWEHREPWEHGRYLKMDMAIEHHWQQAEGRARQGDLFNGWVELAYG